jgi:hypothetical protein
MCEDIKQINTALAGLVEGFYKQHCNKQTMLIQTNTTHFWYTFICMVFVYRCLSMV